MIIIQEFRFISVKRHRSSRMKDCSVVTATYELGEGMRGTIGIIGPKRMDYDKVIGTLKTIHPSTWMIYIRRKNNRNIS